MKKLFIFIAFFYFFGANAQYSKGEIYLNDGTSLKGLIHIKDMCIVRFKANKKDSPTDYDHETIVSVYFNNGKYKYVKSSNNDTPKLLSEMIEGKIKLYSFVTITYGGYSSTGSSSFGSQRIPYYYISVKDSLIDVGSKFKKKQINIFKDCPILIEKIKKKEFKKWDIYDIIQFYNEDCN